MSDYDDYPPEPEPIREGPVTFQRANTLPQTRSGDAEGEADPRTAYLERIRGGGACEGAWDLTLRRINPHRLGPDPENCEYCAFYLHCPIIDAAIARARKAAEGAAEAKPQ